MNSATMLFIIDHLYNKCHLMLIHSAAKYEYDQQLEEERIQREVQIWQEMVQIARANRERERQLREFPWLPQQDLFAPQEELDSDMDDCLIPDPYNELYPTEELTDLDEDDDSILNVIDFTEEL